MIGQLQSLEIFQRQTDQALLVQPELRYWLCERFNGSFFGLHGHYADVNMSNLDIFGWATTAMTARSMVQVSLTATIGY